MFHMPMSSPMMTRMFGGRAGAWAGAGAGAGWALSDVDTSSAPSAVSDRVSKFFGIVPAAMARLPSAGGSPSSQAMRRACAVRDAALPGRHACGNGHRPTRRTSEPRGPQHRRDPRNVVQIRQMAGSIRRDARRCPRPRRMRRGTRLRITGVLKRRAPAPSPGQAIPSRGLFRRGGLRCHDAGRSAASRSSSRSASNRQSGARPSPRSSLPICALPVIGVFTRRIVVVHEQPRARPALVVVYCSISMSPSELPNAMCRAPADEAADADRLARPVIHRLDPRQAEQLGAAVRQHAEFGLADRSDHWPSARCRSPR